MAMCERRARLSDLSTLVSELSCSGTRLPSKGCWWIWRGWIKVFCTIGSSLNTDVTVHLSSLPHSLPPLLAGLYPGIRSEPNVRILTAYANIVVTPSWNWLMSLALADTEFSSCVDFRSVSTLFRIISGHLPLQISSHIFVLEPGRPPREVPLEEAYG